jgi:enoyl-CoA hydratase/carnithine racemase
MEHIRIEHRSPVTTLTLSRPERRNALSLALMSEVYDALGRLPADSQVVILAGDGPAFSAGHDLGEMVDRDARFYTELFDVCTHMMERIHRIPQPVIARVHGIATAAGCQLVASCDLAVAADSATFATPGVKIGLFCSTPMVPISRAVGRKRAMEMLLTGEPIDAATALDWGLVNRVVPADRIDAEIERLVGQIVRYSPTVIGIGKEAFYSQVELDEHRAYDLAKAVMASNARLPDAREGIDAFLAKRPANWPSPPADH